MGKQLTIGQFADVAGISADTLRYYEKLKLIKATTRSRSGYRLYDPEMLSVVHFINGAKALQFTLVEIKQLLTLSTSDQARCSQVLKHTEAKITEAENKIRELKAIKKVLGNILKQCPGDDTSAKACPILDHLQKPKMQAAKLRKASAK
jgi:MerR family Zn(II)-responsive transcriptional regulator of zntA